MSADELKLDKLEAQAVELRTTRNTLFDQIKKLKEERDRHNKASRASRDQAQKHRTERDRINAKIQMRPTGRSGKSIGESQGGKQFKRTSRG